MLERTYQKYKGDVEFLFVYIREAHPADSNWAIRNTVRDPRSQKERNKVATMCNSELKMSIPTVVDDMFDSVNMSYRAWPERIYVIGRDGKIKVKAGVGPWGFKPGVKSMTQYLDSVRPMHEEFVEPAKGDADLVVSGVGPIGEAVKKVVAAIDRRRPSLVEIGS